jgi:hypothetical protein
MVDALRRAHGWLKAGGCVIDVRPTAEPAYLEVLLASRAAVAGRVGDLDDAVGPNARHARADTALSVALERGWFVVETRFEFPFHRYADNVSEVRNYLREDWMGAAIADEALEQATRLMASEPGARVRVREQVGIARLRPRNAGG